MKLHFKLRAGSRISEHEMEFAADASPSGGSQKTQFRLNQELVEADWEEVSPGVYSILLDGKSYEAQVSKPPGETGPSGSSFVVTVGLRHYLLETLDPRRRRRAGAGWESEGPQEILAPMPGKVVRVLVEEGQQVSREQGMLVIEAMKMQNELRAPRAGRVEKIFAAEGMGVETGFRLLRLV